MNDQLCLQILQAVARALNSVNQTISARTFTVKSVSTFASLPAAPSEGMMAGVTDSSTNTWGATIAGGGSFHVLGYFDGTNWTVAGK